LLNKIYFAFVTQYIIVTLNVNNYLVLDVLRS